MIKINSFIHCITVATVVFCTGVVTADDTEIYLSNTNTNTGTVTPNIMFILDTSGSMSSKDGGSITRIDRMKSALNTILENMTNINAGLMRFHNEEGGPVLFPISPIDSDVSEIEGVDDDVPPVVQSHISQGADDAEEQADGTMVLTSEKLEMTELAADITSIVEVEDTEWSENDNGYITGYYRNGMFLGTREAGFLFRDINVPRNANILSAKMRFVVQQEDDAVSNPIRIYGDKTVPSRFTYARYMFSTGLPKTLASVPWTDIPSTQGKIGEELWTPDLSNIVQEVVSMPGWTNTKSTHDIGFMVNPEPSMPDNSPGKRTIHEAHGKQAQLHVQYGDPSSTQITGLRFQEVGIPQGATITSARIEFEAQRADTQATSLIISGHNIGNSPEFTTTQNNISNRTNTSAAVNWNNMDSWVEGNRYDTPDLKVIVQEVVNHSDWCGNNAMSFIIEGTGLRIAQSFEGKSDSAAVLHVNYDESSVSDSACINQIIRKRISKSSDDAEQRIGSSGFLTGSQLEMPYNNDREQLSGLRFELPIFKDATILEANLEFVAKNSDSNTSVSLKINGELSGDSSPFSVSSNAISGRTKTAASTIWNPAKWTKHGLYKSPDIKHVIQEIVNQSGWAAGNAASLIIGRNGNGSNVRRAKTFDDSPGEAPVLVIKVQGKLATGFKTVRKRLKDLVADLPASGWTPLVDILYEAALYYRGNEVFYGKTRGNSFTQLSNPAHVLTTSHAKYTRTSHLASYKGGTLVQATGCTADNLNVDACKTEHIDSSPTYETPITESCQSNNIILLSDGAPTRNYSKSLVANMIGHSCDSTFTSHKKCGPDLAEFLYDEDQTDAFTNDQIVKTYTIGFNIDNSGKQFLKDIAQSGGGEFFSASSSADLVNRFEEIIIDILSHPTSFAAPSLSINAFNKIYHNNEVYFSLFKPDRHKAWAGNIKKYKLCEGKDDTCELGEVLDVDNDQAIGADYYIRETARSFWGTAQHDGPVIKLGGAGDQVPDYGSRTVYTYTDNDVPSNVSIASGNAHKVLTSNTALTKALLGDASMNDAERTQIIDWMRGKDVMDEDGDNTKNENRWIIHDPLHGGAVPVTYGKTSDNAPVIKLFVATNSGSLHMINSETGEEEWAFIPQAMLSQQKDMMNPRAIGDHIYGLDSTPTIHIKDANDDGIIDPDDDYVHLYIGMRRGGRHVYALDVTPKSIISDNSTADMVEPKLLWRIDGGSGDYAKLGQTWSKPIVANISGVNAPVLFMAGGYEESSQDNGNFGVAADHGNALYIINAGTGQRLWWASSDANADLVLPTMTYPIPSDLGIFDTQGDGVIDRLYVGDMGGQVWRINFPNGITGTTGARLATISSSSNVADQRKFFYAPDVAQINDKKYSAIPVYDLITIGTGNRDHPLGTDVHDRFYAFRDYHPLVSTFDDDNARITSSDLYDASENKIQSDDESTQKIALDNLKAHKGWYMNMQDNNIWKGEKILARSLIIDGKLFFTSYLPKGTENSQACASAVEGGGRLYGVDLLTAGAIYKGWSGSKDELKTGDRRYDVGSGIASEPIPIFQENGVTLLVGSGGGATSVDPKIGLPRKKTFWLQEAIDGSEAGCYDNGTGLCPL